MGETDFLDPMHACINVDEIVRLLACELAASGAKATAAALACCCKNFEDPVLDALWGTQDQLTPLLDTFLEGVWDETPHFVSLSTTPYFLLLNGLNGKAFKRMPTTSEWIRFKKYARRMRELELDISGEPITSDTLSTLQLRTLNEPLLPNIKTLRINGATADTISFVPMFLAHRTTDIEIQFAASPPPVMVASMIINLPKLCPYLEAICLQDMQADTTITGATSEMLLTCNLDTLQHFLVDSPLTEEARQVVYQLPNLRGLWSVFTERTSLPAVSLPSLTTLDVEYHHDHDWLRAFHRTAPSKLIEASFHAECDRIGDFLEAFEAAFSSSASALLRFMFFTSSSWDPRYYALLSFKQLNELIIEFSCQNGCSSSVDDETLTTLAQAMPKLEILQLGKTPCQAPSNVTVQGLIALARHCSGLSKLRIHFQTDSLVAALANEAIPDPSNCLLRSNCALASLEVGEIPISPQHMLSVFLTLICIFPRLLLIEYTGEGWKWVADSVRLSKKIDYFVHRSGKPRPP